MILKKQRDSRLRVALLFDIRLRCNFCEGQNKMMPTTERATVSRRGGSQSASNVV